jgi:hypothetical protein
MPAQSKDVPNAASALAASAVPHDEDDAGLVPGGGVVGIVITCGPWDLGVVKGGPVCDEGIASGC